MREKTLAVLEEERRRVLDDFKQHKVPSYLTLEKLRKLDAAIRIVRRKAKR